jgi:hypothetical protein
MWRMMKDYSWPWICTGVHQGICDHLAEWEAMTDLRVWEGKHIETSFPGASSSSWMLKTLHRLLLMDFVKFNFGKILFWCLNIRRMDIREWLYSLRHKGDRDFMPWAVCDLVSLSYLCSIPGLWVGEEKSKEKLSVLPQFWAI